MKPTGHRPFKHPMSQSLNYAIFLCVAGSIMIGLGVCWFMQDFRRGSGKGMILWAGLIALAVVNTISSTMGIHRIVRTLIAESQSGDPPH
jgi:hypothetical protein